MSQNENGYEDLKSRILEALSDKQSLNIKWIGNRLKDDGIEATWAAIKIACQLLVEDGKLEITGKYCNKTEYRVVA